MFIHVNPSVPLVDLTSTTTNGVRFYTTPDNIQYPSITTILGDVEKPWLEIWKQGLGHSKAAAETERCSDRGTEIHLLAEQYLNNQPVEIDTKTGNGGLFFQIRPHLNKINNIRAQEAALWSDKLKIAGRVDCVGEYEGQLAIIDFKTSNSLKHESMIEDYYLQCTAYALMWFERTNEPITDFVILMAVERGITAMKFTGSIDKYVQPLLKRIGTYYNRRTPNV